MAEPFNSIPAHLRDSTNAACSDRGKWTDEHAAWLRSGTNSALVRAFMDEKMGVDAERRRAAEEADRIVIINSGYDGGAADQQRCKGPYWTYPTGWTPNSAMERAKNLAPHFPGVDFSHVEVLAERFYVNVPATEASEGGYRDAPKNGRKLVLPEHADGGLLVWPKLAAIVKCVKKPKKSWQPHNIAVEYILGVLKELFPNFYDATNGKVAPEYEHMLELTAKMLAKLDAETPGDVLVEPFNAGALFAGYNVRSSRGHMEALKTHLPATNVMNFCRAIGDPKSFVNGSLVADCPGVERAPYAVGVFGCAPCLRVYGGRLYYGSCFVDGRSPSCGSASVVLRGAAPVPSE